MIGNEPREYFNLSERYYMSFDMLAAYVFSENRTLQF